MKIGCDFSYWQTNVPLQIQEAITTDAGQHVLITRFFHNKVIFYSINFLRCYFGFFNLLYIIVLYGIHKLLQRIRKVFKK